MADDVLLNATICKGVAVGHCVMLADTDLGEQEIVYAGPLKTSPSAAGKLVLLSEADFNTLRGSVERHRH